MNSTMKTTKLIIDEKVTIWRRSEIIVPTADLDNAKAEGKIKELIELHSFNYHNSELLLETEESFTPIQNDNEPTIEVFEEDDMSYSIYHN